MRSRIILWSVNGDAVNALREANVEVTLLPPSVETIPQLSEAAKWCKILCLDIGEGSCSWNAYCVFRNAQPDGDVILLASDPAGENSQEVLRYLESGARDYVDATSPHALELKLQPFIERHEAQATLENKSCRHSQRNRWFECLVGQCVIPSGSRRSPLAGSEARASSSSNVRHGCPDCEKASDAANLKAELMSLKARLTVLKGINDEMQQQTGQFKESEDTDMFQLIISASGEDPETAAWIESEFVGSTRGNPPSCRRKSMDGSDSGGISLDSDRPRAFGSGSRPGTPQQDPENRWQEYVTAIAERGLDSWDTDMLNLPEDRLVDIAMLLLEERGTLTVLRTSRSRLERFVRSIRSKYHDNPYHNFRHAVDVLKCLHIFFTKGRAEQFFLPDEIVGGMLAALGHDVDHPGRNNLFLINTRHHLARLYNDRAVLENHHAATLYLIVQDESCNIFANLTSEEWMNMRQIITAAILATDMAQHLDILSRVKDLTPRAAFHTDDSQHRLLLLNALLHAADISNPIKPWDLSKAWSARVTDEFLQQGDAERQLGQPVTPFMDRLTASEARNTLNFIDFAAAPLYAVLKDILPALAPCYELLLENRERWVALLESQEPIGSKAVSELRRRSLIDRRRSRSRSRSRSFTIFKTMQQGDLAPLPTTPSLPASALLTLPQGASPVFHSLSLDGDNHQDSSGAAAATGADDGKATISMPVPHRKSSQSPALPAHIQGSDRGVPIGSD